MNSPKGSRGKWRSNTNDSENLQNKDPGCQTAIRLNTYDVVIMSHWKIVNEQSTEKILNM